jgi:hypothetical protein
VHPAAVRTIHFQCRPPGCAQTLYIRLNAGRCVLIGFGTNEKKWGHGGRQYAPVCRFPSVQYWTLLELDHADARVFLRGREPRLHQVIVNTAPQDWLGHAGLRSRSSPELSVRSAFNRRTSSESRCGSGDEATSANVVRNAPASVSGRRIVWSSGTKVGIVGSPQERPRPSYVDNATHDILFMGCPKEIAVGNALSDRASCAGPLKN